jgi:2-dehydropantoate 2-reductase
MRIAVVGVGGGFGVALAKAGPDVTFIARGAHLAAMKSQG